MININHPLPEGTRVKAMQKTCACQGGKMRVIEGKILKTIVNHSGTWYYLDIGATIKADLIQQVI